MDVALGVVLGMVLAASLAAGWRLIRAPRVLDPGSAAMQRAVHAATTILPHLRRGLTRRERRVGRRAAARRSPAPTRSRSPGPDALLAFDGPGADHHRAGDPLDAARPERGARSACTSSRGSPARTRAARCARRSSRRWPCATAGSARSSRSTSGPGRVRLEESRVVAEAAALVSAMVELSELEAQGERLARAELRALRAQISPHFIYNALAAVAAFIHSRPEEARELLIEFSEFIRYAFARQRPYVTLADELQYVEKYLRLEQARFGERLRVRVQVDPEVLHAVVPVLSLQPLVENAVRHGVESRAEGGLVSIEGIDLGADVELRVCDDGDGIDPERAAEALAGRGPGIGLGNVHGRLQSTFGEGYGLVVENGDGTTVVMTLPKFRAGVRAG